MKFSLRTLLVVALLGPPLLGYLILRVMAQPPRLETYAAPPLDILMGCVRDLLLVSVVVGMVGAWWFRQRLARKS